jgi:plastocyanin/quercetin dioxygenase-like cupin family protein
MNGTLAARLLRIGMAFLLAISMAGGAFAATLVAASAQPAGSEQLPGFDDLPPEAELLAYASGTFSGEGVASLIVERIELDADTALDLVAGPFIVLVEQGSLVYEDDLGLEAELGAGDSQFFAPGEGDTLASGSGEPAVILRTALITDTPINGAPGPEDGGDDAPEGELLEIEISAIDVAFEETEIEAPADTDFTITVTNNGVAVHGFVIEGTDYQTDYLESGESETITVNLPAGEYTFYCPVPGHREAGMEGTLIVTEDGDVTVTPDADEPDQDDSDDTGADDDRGPGEDTPIDPRDDHSGSSLQLAGSVNALILQETTAPDEVVISLTDDGFTPDRIEIARGGALVIENAGDTACEFSIEDLDLQFDLGIGDIEQVTIEGQAGDHQWACTAANGDLLGDGVMTVVDESAGDDPAEESTPESTEEATPVPDEEETGDDAQSDVPIGMLLQTAVTLEGDSDLFSAIVSLQPGGVMTLNEADGSLGVMVTGGDLTVTRPGRAPATLRDGRSVILPSGTSAEMANNGDTPITILLAGVTGSTDAPDADTGADTGEPEQTGTDTGNSETSGNAGPDGLYVFFPDDSELEELGLFPTWVAFTEISDPASNTFWFSGRDAAEASLTEWDWIRSSELRYDSAGEETAYGPVSVFGILIDSFEDDAGAASFFEYIADDPTGEAVAFLDGIAEVQGAVAFNFSGIETITTLVAIHSGTYVITLFASGPGLDTEALLADVANLIFGVVG